MNLNKNMHTDMDKDTGKYKDGNGHDRTWI
jgi:hypothetical protein